MHTNWLPRTMRPQENQKLLVIFKNSVKAIQANARAMTMKKHVAINLHAHETQEPWIKPYCKQPWCTWNARTNSNDTLKANSLIWSKTFGNHSRPIMKTLQTCMLFVCFLLYNQKNRCKLHCPKCSLHWPKKMSNANYIAHNAVCIGPKNWAMQSALGAMHFALLCLKFTPGSWGLIYVNFGE